MSPEPSADALRVIRQVGLSQAAMEAAHAFKQYKQGVREGRDPDVCFLEAFMGIYKTPKFPGPPPPQPFDTVEDLRRVLQQALMVFKEAADLVKSDLVDVDALLKEAAVP